MKIRHIFITLVLLWLCGCGALPPDAAATPPTPPGQSARTGEPGPAITDAAAPASTAPAAATPTRSPSPVPSASPTQTATATITPRPTRASPYPVGLGTPLPDAAFPEINFENAAGLGMVFRLSEQRIWQTATSRDGQKLFVATNNGIYVFDRQGQQLAYWPSLVLYHLPCETCLSINTDGSRFAMATHREGKWFAQVYNVHENSPLLVLDKPMEAPFRGIPNEVRIAIPPDNTPLLAYGATGSDLVVTEMNTGEVLLTHKTAAEAATFTPDGAYFVVRRGREMLFWNTDTWRNPTNLLLPTENIPFTFSPDMKRIAVVAADKVRIYDIERLAQTREISIRPDGIVPRTWQTKFVDDKILAGYSLRWNSTRTVATIDVARWDLETGETLQMERSETDSPDLLSALWGAEIRLTTPPGPVPIVPDYSVFRYVGPDHLLINSRNSACWLKPSIGETTCFDDPENKVLTTQVTAYKEIRQERSTLVQKWDGETTFTMVSPYEILRLGWSGEHITVSVNDVTTDVYFSARRFPIASFPGTLYGYAENVSRIALSSLQEPSSVTIAMVDKTKLTEQTLYQKRETFAFKPLALTTTNNVYFVQQTPGQEQFALKMIDGQSYAVNNVARISLPAAPEVVSVSPSGIFAFGLRDGSVALVSPDGLQVFSWQAIYSTVTGISFSPDGRYLAVASEEGIRIYAVLPEQR